MTSKRALITWRGDLATGNGRVLSSTSGALENARVSWPARTSEPSATSPEEMIAAAHASCFAMAFAGGLAAAGFTPAKLDVAATVTFEPRAGDWSITRVWLDVLGWVPGIDDQAFSRLAMEAKETCPVSRALKGNVEVGMSASLSTEDVAAAAAS